MADLTRVRCKACGAIHRERETCPTCAEKRRREVREQQERERREKQTPMPGLDPFGYFAADPDTCIDDASRARYACIDPAQLSTASLDWADKHGHADVHSVRASWLCSCGSTITQPWYVSMCRCDGCGTWSRREP